MTPHQKFDLTVRSAVIRSEKPNKGLEAIPTNNPNQSNRVIGYLADGTKVVVAQRPGKGGMDFNKLMGGKVFMIAADGISPVYEKGEDKKPTKIQKVEDGLPLYSSSGFYLLSSKEYPALDVFDAYTRLLDNGQHVLSITESQLAQRQRFVMESELDWEFVQMALLEALADESNLLSRFDADINKKRERGIKRAKEEAEDTGDAYEGVDYAELKVSKKDGNPMVLFSWTTPGAQARGGVILRQANLANAEGKVFAQYFGAQEALDRFMKSDEFKALEKALGSGEPVTFTFVSGHMMRTSVSFKRKAENVLAAGTDKPLYGDAVYVHAALKGWVKGLVTLMHSQHPNFPSADYDAHHYVAACRQAEVGMNKLPNNSGWSSPHAPAYDLVSLLAE